MSSTGSKLTQEKSEDTTESFVYQSSVEEKSEDISGVARDVSSDSFGFEETKSSEEVDELLLLVMPPGHAKIDMKDRDDHEFDQVNAPRITITPSLDEVVEEETSEYISEEPDNASEDKNQEQQSSSMTEYIEEVMKPVLAHSKVTSEINDIVSRCKESFLEKIEEDSGTHQETESNQYKSQKTVTEPEDNGEVMDYSETPMQKDMVTQEEDAVEEELVPTLCSLANALVKPESIPVQDLETREQIESEGIKENLEETKPEVDSSDGVVETKLESSTSEIVQETKIEPVTETVICEEDTVLKETIGGIFSKAPIKSSSSSESDGDEANQATEKDIAVMGEADVELDELEAIAEKKMDTQTKESSEILIEAKTQEELVTDIKKEDTIADGTQLKDEIVEKVGGIFKRDEGEPSGSTSETESEDEKEVENQMSLKEETLDTEDKSETQKMDITDDINTKVSNESTEMSTFEVIGEETLEKQELQENLKDIEILEGATITHIETELLESSTKDVTSQESKVAIPNSDAKEERREVIGRNDEADEEIPNLVALAKDLVKSPLTDDSKPTEEAKLVQEKDSETLSDFRLMKSFRSHYVVDKGKKVDTSLSTEQKEKELDHKIIDEDKEKDNEKQVMMETTTKHMMLKMSESTGSKVESVEDEQESGLEITTGKEHKSYEDSTLMDHSSEFFGSDRTDSLLQESTLHESYLMEKTLSEQTLAAEFPTETVECAFELEKSGMEKIMAKETVSSLNASNIQSTEATKTPCTDHQEMILEQDKSVEEGEQKGRGEEGKLIVVQEEIEIKATEHQELETTIKIEDIKIMEKQMTLELSAEEVEETSRKQEVSSETADKGPISETKSKRVISETKIVSTSEHSVIDKEKSIFVSSPITETVELTPILSWQLETGEEDKIEEAQEKDMKQTEVSGMSIKHLESSDSPRESTDSPSASPPNTSRCSSYMTERSGTQSSIEVRSSSKSSHHTTSSRASSFLESDEKSEHKSSVSIQERSSSNVSSNLKSGSSPPKSSSYLEESSVYSHITTTSSRDTDDLKKERTSSESSAKHVKLSDHSPDVAPPSPGFEMEERPSTETSSSPPRKSPVSQLQQDALSESAHSLPSSPRRIQRAHSGGVKKLTSESFSTESDICKSLELVYVEPGEDSRRKLSERYRHSSSSGNSDGSMTHETAGQERSGSVSKLEKRKPSVTQIRKSSEVSAESSGHSSLVTTEPEQEQIERSKTSSSEPYDLQHKTETTADSYNTKSPTSSPPPSSSDKKIPSPTKIRPPIQSTASLKEQISEEILSPSLEVECHTPEKTMLSGKGKGGCCNLEK